MGGPGRAGEALGVHPDAPRPRCGEQFGDESALVSYEGAGHGAYGVPRGSECVNTIAADYLIEGEVPAGGTRCPAVPYEPSEE